MKFWSEKDSFSPWMGGICGKSRNGTGGPSGASGLPGWLRLVKLIWTLLPGASNLSYEANILENI